MTINQITAAYARYDSDPRVNGPDDFDAFRDAVDAPYPPTSSLAAPASLFEGDSIAALLSAALLKEITEAYREMLLLNPPTPSFNTRTNPNAEKFAGFASKKDVTRFLAVLDKKGLTITEKEKI